MNKLPWANSRWILATPFLMLGNYAKKNTSETNGQINSVNEENNVVEEGVQLKNHQD
jgi:hypothetical protein